MSHGGREGGVGEVKEVMVTIPILHRAGVICHS